MKRESPQIRELFNLLRMLQVLHEVESVEKVYRMLLSLTTSVSLTRCRRAMLFEPDWTGDVLRGSMGCSHQRRARTSFEAMARDVFENFEQTPESELSLLVRGFVVPLQKRGCGLVKALRGGYPVLAHRNVSEFTSDPFFAYFGSECYVALPVKGSGGVSAVLAADSDEGTMERDAFSLLYSLTQRASSAVAALTEKAEARRRLSTLVKVERVLASGTKGWREELEEVLAIVSRSLGATGGVLKTYTDDLFIHVMSVALYDPSPEGGGGKVVDSLERLIDSCGARGRGLCDERSHPLLEEAAREELGSFLVQPLPGREGCLGGVAFYRLRGKGPEPDLFSSRDLSFLELVARALAAAVAAREDRMRAKRNEEMIEELRSHLVKERGRARLADKGLEFARRVRGVLAELEGLTDGVGPAAAKVEFIRGISEEFLEEGEGSRDAFKMLDLFSLARAVLSRWLGVMEGRGVMVEADLDRGRCPMLMDEEKVVLALESIIKAIASTLERGDRLMVKTYREEDKAHVVLADTGRGLPGEVLSRLFMPFRAEEGGGEEQGHGLSLAADIIQLHGGEVRVKSSLGWRTILVLSFPLSANRDRRKRRRDRRVASRTS